jgi:hypothetical protein
LIPKRDRPHSPESRVRLGKKVTPPNCSNSPCPIRSIVFGSMGVPSL